MKTETRENSVAESPVSRKRPISSLDGPGDTSEESERPHKFIVLDPQQAPETEGGQASAGIPDSEGAGEPGVEDMALESSPVTPVSPVPSEAADDSDDDDSEPIPHAQETRSNTLLNIGLTSPLFAGLDPARPETSRSRKRVTFAPFLITETVDGDGPPPELSQRSSELSQRPVDSAEAAVQPDGIKQSEGSQSDDAIRPNKKRKGEEFIEEAQINGKVGAERAKRRR